MQFVIRILAVVASLAPAFARSAEPVNAPANSPAAAVTTAFLQKACFDCHGAEAADGVARLDTLASDLDDAETFRRWVRLFDRVEKREMPPRDAAAPSDAERAKFLDSLRRRLIDADRRQAAAGQHGGVRRMNRVEYEHTLQDLLALPLLRVKEMLPEDGQQHGFDKVGGALDVSPVQMTKYLQATDVALRQAIVRAAKAPESRTWREPAARQHSAQAAIAIHCAAPLIGRQLAPGLVTHIVGNPVKDIGNTYRAATFRGDADSVALLSGVLGAHQPEGLQIDRFKPEVGGWYRVKFSVWGLRWERTRAAAAVRGPVHRHIVYGEPYYQDEKGKWRYTRLETEKKDAGWRENVEFYGEGPATHVVRASLKGKPIGFFDAPSLEPKTHEFQVWLNPGERISFHAMTLPATGAANSGSHDGVVTYEGPGIAFDWFEVEGPLVEQWPPESQRRLFGELPIAAYPRPPQPGLPTVAAGGRQTIAADAWKGAGQLVGDQRLLNLAGTTTARINAAVAGTYELSVTAFETPAGDEPTRMRLLVDGREPPHARFTVDAPRSAPKSYRARVQLESPGPIELGVEFLNDFFDEQAADPQRRDRNLFVTSLEIVGPPAPKTAAAADAATAAGASPQAAPSVRSLLLAFANRAFRRPVASDEVDAYVAIVESLLAKGVGFEEAMLAGQKAVLCSPDFLFLGLEPNPPPEAAASKSAAAPTGNDDYRLASRLSYFLWNSAPDDQLLALAGRGELARPDVLRRQVDRLLDDPRSERFVEHFLDEWLELKKIDFTTPDPQLYPEYDPWLRDSMLVEPRAFFRQMIRDDLSASHLIASDFVMVNQRLAELYGIRGVNGAELRKVSVPPGSRRGGFLTQAAVLKVTANGTATSPVLRGVWVIERLLGVPRDPPPPNVPAVEPDATGAVTIRQMIEKHRADPVCASCHAKMDPPGLALESFDVLGGLRERYRLSGQPKKIRKGKEVLEEPSIEVVSGAAHRNRIKLRLGSEVDSSGQLADGRAFDDVDGLRRLLLADQDQLARNMARQLTIYATGADVRFSDRAAIEAIVARTREKNHGLRTLLHEVATFLAKQN